MNTREATTNVELASHSNRGPLPTEATQPAALNQISMPAPVQQPSVATMTSTIPQNVVPYLPYGYGDQFFPAYNYAMPPYAGFMPMAPVQQFQSLRPIAPKPQEHRYQPANRALSRPPNFIETVKILRKQLYDLAGTEESQEPPEGEVYSKWRKAVTQEWRPINMSHYMMVAKLSKRCFRLVLQIPEGLKVRVTQSDFLDLYGKTEEMQFKLLCAVLDGTISFQDLKRRRRAKPEATRKTPNTGNHTKELEEEIARLKSQNLDLLDKLQQAIQERDEQKKRADDLHSKIKILEKENEKEFHQYRKDVDLLIEEKNDLGESFLSQQSRRSDRFNDSMSEKSSHVSLSSDFDQNTVSDMVSETDSEDVPLAQVKKNTKSTGNMSTPKVKRSAKKRRKEERSRGSYTPSTDESSESDGSEPERPTKAETLRMEAKGLKKKLLKNKPTHRCKKSNGSTEKAPATEAEQTAPERSATSPQPYQDDWDYDIQWLNPKEWVAVAYEENYFVGQIEKRATKKVWVTFLAERAGVFHWPQNKDRDQVAPEFIFRRNLEVTNDEENKSVYLVKNLEGLKAKFRDFSRKYFS